MEDAQRAIRLVRYNSEKWNIDKGKIGIMGFSQATFSFNGRDTL